MINATIIGSGFGLYGYLPALISNGFQKIYLQERYKEKFLSRNDLSIFQKYIEWTPSEEDAARSAELIIFAINPESQAKKIFNFLGYENIKCYVLEKPIGITPSVSSDIINEMERSNKYFIVGYLFLYTKWANKLIKELKDTQYSKVVIKWFFLAHHYKFNLSNWKKYNSQGGSAIRFYGIQIIALLAKIGYTDIISSKVAVVSDDEFESWDLIIKGKNLPICEVYLKTKSLKELFFIELHKKHNTQVIANQRQPFEKNLLSFPEADNRAPELISLINDIKDLRKSTNSLLYLNIIDLWRKIEFVTEINNE